MKREKIIGIYLITNKINGKRYVGQSYDIKGRWNAHLRCKKNFPLYNAMRKYGDENFSFEILRKMPEENALTSIILDSLETHYIKIWKLQDNQFGYNLRSGGANGRHSAESLERMKIAQHGRPRHLWSAESRKKLSNSIKGIRRHAYDEAFRAKLSIAARGRKRTEEVKAKMSAAQKGKSHGPMKEETKKRLSEALKGKKTRPCSEETKKKIAERARQRWARYRENKSKEIINGYVS